MIIMTSIDYDTSWCVIVCIDDLMERTFALRYAEIQGKAFGINSLLDRYPFLQEPAQVITMLLGHNHSNAHSSYISSQLMLDMERLVGDENLKTTCLRVWKDLPLKILRQAKLESAHNSRLCSTIRENEIYEEGK